jgi:dTDP-glucose pyrophosphorylase
MRRGAPGVSLEPAQADAADTGVKALVPVGGRPFLDYLLSALADARFERACLVIGPEQSALREYAASGRRSVRIEIAFAVQQAPLGTADALIAAEPVVAGDEFAVMNGDNYYPAQALRLLQEIGQPGAVLFDAEALVRESNIPAERVGDFAYATVDRDGFLTDLIEKPGRGATDRIGGRPISMNLWRFDAGIFRTCRDVPRSARGEFELPGAVKLAIERGARLRTVTCRAGVLDLSRRADIAAVEARLRDVPVNP